MSDRLAVMSSGKVAQVGAPRELYEEPAGAYVADFLGISNLMDAVVVRPAPTARGGSCQLRIGDFDLESCCGATTVTGEVKVAIRPERVGLGSRSEPGVNSLPGMVERVVFVGPLTQGFVHLVLGVPLQSLLKNDGNAVDLEKGTPVSVSLPADALRVLAKDGPARGAVSQSAVRGL